MEKLSRLKIIAHRGDSQARPENTMSAVLSAIEVGSDLVEFDVRVIKGGALYLFHDGDLKRFGLGDRAVASLNESEVKQMDVGTWFNPKFASERPPLLRDAVTACLNGNTIPLIERKTGSAEAYAAVIRELKAEEHVIVQSFDWDFLAELRKLSPKVRLGALSGDRMTPDLWEKVEKLKPNWVGWREKYLTEKAVQRFQGNNMNVAVWTVNDLNTIARVAEWGVDAVITDRPKAALEIVSSGD